MAEQDPNTMVHTHVDENGNVITHCHGGRGTPTRTRTPTRRPRRSSTGWPARSAIWSRSSAW
ncbi:MAG: hypothetical protein ACLSHG_11095 [Oscillospiraceae bacterium]